MKSLVVYRIHYLRAAARYDRWAEEEVVTAHEMVWSRNYFQHRADVWTANADGPLAVTPGHTCYALRQSAFWKKLATTAWTMFKVVNPRVKQVFGADQGND